MQTRRWFLVAAGGLIVAAAGCVNVKAPERIEIGTSRPEPVDSSRIPDPQTLDEARADLRTAYENIQYLEQQNQALREKADKYKRERDQYKKQLKKYEKDQTGAMAITFVLGRAGAGKTRYCVDALLSALGEPDAARRLILLVPEQASFQMERLLATRSAHGGYCRAAVLSFSRLARIVFAEVGGEPAQISANARVMALRCAAQRMGKSLRFFRTAAQTPGFYHQVNGVIEELLRERITPEDLRRAARAVTERPTKRKVGEIGRLYREYLAWLGPERVDPVMRLAVARERLASVAWLRDASIWVDGFAGFTGQELATLVTLARGARELTITLLLDPASPAVRAGGHAPDALDLFQRTERTYQRLALLMAEAGAIFAPTVILGAPALPRFADVPALARLEAGLATPIGAPLEAPTGAAQAALDGVTVLECGTHRDELRQAAQFIRQKIVEAGGRLRFRDFALIARDLEPFAEIIAEVFAEYDIPYFLDRRRPMRSHPVSRLMDALFAAVTGGFSVAAMTRLLRTGLLPLSRAQVEELENMIVAYAVHGVEAWQQPVWSFSDDSFQGPSDGGHAGRRGRTPPGDSALDAARLAVVAALEPLRRLAETSPAPTGAVWAQTLHEVLETLGVRRQIAAWIAASRSERSWERAETHRLAWEALCAVLTDLHDVLGDMPLRADEVAATVGAALREETLGLAPPTLDQVLVSAIERSRHPDIKYAWVFAFNEGVFPARPPEDELLSATERGQLTEMGLLAPASHREEAFAERLLAYVALTRPSHGLTISYATVGMDGAPLLPSPLLDDVRRALPGLAPCRPPAHEPPVCLTELAREYLHARSKTDVQPQAYRRYERLCADIRASTGHGARLAWLLRGTEYRNASETVGRNQPARDPDVVWDGSPSEVETYLDCSFKHWVTHGLRLDPARGPRPAAWDLGNAAHAILADVTRRAMDHGGDVRKLTDGEWQGLLRAAIENFQESLPADLHQRRPELAFLSERLYAFLADVVLVHAERWRRGQFAPLACEQAFGERARAADWPPLELRTADDRRLLLHGRIDRLDCLDDGQQVWLLVYDYKPHAANLTGDFLTGVRLQLFSYLLAAQNAHRREGRTQVVGALVAPLYPDLKALDPQYARAAPEIEQRMYLYRPRGMFTRDAARLLDQRLGTVSSPIVCVRLKQDGDFDQRQSANAVEPGEITQRLELAKQTVLLAAEGIVSGQIEAAPLVENRTLACTRCEFRPVCRFDRAINRMRQAEVVLPRLAPREPDVPGEAS